VATASAAVLVTLLCVRNRFLFTMRLYEDADMGANSILVEQARHFTLLVGNYSRDHFHHPGPAYMYVKAAGESLFWAWLHMVPTAWNGQLLAIYALNGMFMALVVGVGYGWTGSLRGAAACVAVVVALASVHPAALSSDWMPYMYVPAYVAFLVTAASVAAGGARDAWMLALTGWFLIHGHACFLLFVPVIGCAVLVAVLWPRRHSLGASVRSFLATQRRAWVPVAVISAVFALPIIANLVLHWPGEFGDYLTYAASRQAGGHSVAQVVRDALWYWWPHRDAWLFPVAGYAVAVAVTRWLAPVRLRRFLIALLAVNAVSSLAFLYYAATGIDVLSRHYVGYFYWSAPVITLLVITVGVVEAMPLPLGAFTAAGAAVLALAALAWAADTRTSTNSSDPAVPSSGPDTDPALPGAVATLAAQAGGRTIVLRFDFPSWPDVTGFLVQAERTGVRACVADPASIVVMTRQFICTRADIVDGRVYWFHAAAPRDGTVIVRLRQAMVTGVSLVQARIVGIRGHVGELAPLAAQHGRPEPLRVGAERVGRLGGHHVPGAVGDLRLELPGAPAGVARVDPQRHDRRGEQAGRRVQVDQAEPGHGGRAVQRMPAHRLVGARHVGEGERAVRRDRAAGEHHGRVGGQLGPRLEHLADRDLGRPVQHHAEGALLGLVLDDQDDGAAEVGIAEHRGGDEQTAGQGFRCHFVHISIIILRFGSRRAPWPPPRAAR